MSRRLVFTAAALALSAIGASATLDLAPRLVWNATASAPLGLWRGDPNRRPEVGDWALVRLNSVHGEWMAARGALPLGAVLLKVVAAQEGQTVCRRGVLILVDGRPTARASQLDSRGRRLPAWNGCRTLAEGEIFLLNRHPDSLDGRYFGVTPPGQVLGRATLVWRR